MNWKTVLSFILGTAAGSVGTYFIMRDKIEQVKEDEELTRKAMEEIIEAERERKKKYKSCLNSIYGVKSMYAGRPENPSKNASTSSSGSYTETLMEDIDKTQKEEIMKAQKALKRNWTMTTNYAEMYKKGSDDGYLKQHPDPVVLEYPKEDLDEISEDEYDKMEKEHLELQEQLEHEEKERQRILMEGGDIGKPRIISINEEHELTNVRSIDVISYDYYFNNDVVVESDGNMVIDDPEISLGDCLNVSDFRTNDDGLLIVYNPELNAIFEVSKVMDYWIDS